MNRQIAIHHAQFLIAHYNFPVIANGEWNHIAIDAGRKRLFKIRKIRHRRWNFEIAHAI